MRTHRSSDCVDACPLCHHVRAYQLSTPTVAARAVLAGFVGVVQRPASRRPRLAACGLVRTVEERPPVIPLVVPARAHAEGLRAVAASLPALQSDYVNVELCRRLVERQIAV